jgi:myo-inositol catabolism protein IolC
MTSETVAKMVAAFNTEAATEMYYAEQVAKIREYYQAAEVAAAGIFTSKFLDRKALTDLVYGQAAQRTIIIDASTTWSPPRLCRRSGL